VTITDQYGCKSTLSTFVDLFESPSITVSPTVYGFVNDTTEIWAEGDGQISWGPPNYISCINCPRPLVYPPYNYIYTATVTDENSCIAQADVEINYDPLIYVPNVFTPDGDSFNNTFFAVANNIREFEMYIFNRWGELIFVSNSIDTQWNGTYNGIKSPDGVYVWKIKYRDINGIDYEQYGHVTLLR
jgi:gliding motility-associated-like protein